TITIGATTPIAALSELAEAAPALVACSENVADYEIRGQGTVAGNLCASRGVDAPRGDLQGAFLALAARVRSVGPAGERTEPVEEFLATGLDRLVLDISFELPEAAAFAVLEYPHVHEYTVLAVSGVRARDGAIRLAATGLAGVGARLHAAEAAAADIDA